jgi:hypothetical protein
MKVGGISIILILGLLNMALLIFQFCSGLRLIKVPFGTHRKIGITLFVTALVHGTLGLIAQM